MEPPPTHRLAGPLALPVAQAHTLQHVATGLVGPAPGIADLVGLATLMAAICSRERGAEGKHHSRDSSVVTALRAARPRVEGISWSRGVGW